MPLRVAFLGSPAFAVPSLDALVSRHSVALVVTQPPRPLGRGLHREPTAVHQAATALGLPCMTYERGGRAALDATLADLHLDLLVVVAFGHILRERTWTTARCGALNVHASLLPRWRGAAPIEHALWAGDAETGVSLMVIDAGLDTGPVLARAVVPIGATETRVELAARLSRAGAALLLEHIEAFAGGRLPPVAQDDAFATQAPALGKADGRIDWRADAARIERQVRALYGWPGAWTTLGGAVLKVHAARVVEAVATAPPGTVLGADPKTGVHVACGSDALQLVQVQLAGKSRVAATALVQGRSVRPGAVLGADARAGEGTAS